MEPSAMDVITTRLASLDNLYFPGAFHRSVPDPDPDPISHRKSSLLDLLSRDAPIFLERYGSALTPDELRQFDVLRADYEVDWHLKRLSETTKVSGVRVRNRRRAYMEKLVVEGDYFSEEEMREREPYLHHEYLGRFQDPEGRVMARPGEKWSETLLRRCEEAAIVEKIRGEQIRRGVDPKEWVGGGAAEQNMGEEDEEEEEEEEEQEEMEEEEAKAEEKFPPMEVMAVEDSAAPDSNGTSADSLPAETFKQTLSAEEMQEQMEQFTYVMQQKFLMGEDTEYLDYSRIDNDEKLDDYWSREANLDAEDKYFEED